MAPLDRESLTLRLGVIPICSPLCRPNNHHSTGRACRYILLLAIRREQRWWMQKRDDQYRCSVCVDLLLIMRTIGPMSGVPLRRHEEDSGDGV
jgi:hypothetical protein